VPIYICYVVKANWAQSAVLLRARFNALSPVRIFPKENAKVAGEIVHVFNQVETLQFSCYCCG
jgi:hypothetical protein